MTMRLPGMVALVAVVVAASACGGRGTTPSVAELSPGASHSSTPAHSDALALAFARCMRDHGVDMPDPGPPPGDLTVRIPHPDSASSKAALDACRRFLPSGELQPGNPKSLDLTLQLARCLRDHGIDVPDPTSNDPHLAVPPAQKTSEAFARALQVCMTEQKSRRTSTAPSP